MGILITLYLLRPNKRPIGYNTTDIMVVGYFLFVFCNYFFRGLLLSNSFIAFMLLPVLYFLTKGKFSSENSFQKFILLAFLLTGIFTGAHGFLQLMGLLSLNNSLSWVTGSFLNPGPFSIYLISFFPISLSMFLFLKKMERPIDYALKCASGIAIFLILLILPQTGSRTSWIACSVATLLIFALRYDVHKTMIPWWTTTRNKAITLFLIVSIAGGAVLLYKMKKDSVHGRAFIWKVAGMLVIENPILGTGFNGVRKAYNNQQADYFANHPSSYDEISIANQVNYLFNDYLQILVEEGLVGFIIFLTFVVSLIYVSVTTIRSDKTSGFRRIIMIGSFSSLCLLLITCLFSYSLETLPTAINFIFFTGLVASFSVNRFTVPQHKKLQRYSVMLLGAAAIIICIVIFTNESSTYVSFHMVVAKGDNDRLKLFKENYDNLKRDPTCMLEYGKLLTSYSKYEESIFILTTTSKFLCDTSLYRSMGDSYHAMGNYREAQNSYLKSIHIAPHRFLPRYYLVKSYLESGDTARAVAMAKYIVDLPIKIDAPIVHRIKDEMEELIKKPNSL